ncbi:Uu.00g028780.m01.CDS01 [Anthostomella pinea]|uniref:Uu.00g028780.m01.CDS01 n=1 Tax=Anthostomella pinea TaxID=933095 RepID=A0AAI8YCS8_9PEZI|nr:Uu.00g028780.m01.CDS01 [Anthostomella pinea]
MAAPNRLQSLPDELFLQILSFLDTHDIVKLQPLSKHFLRLCRDSTVWRHRCLLASALLERVQLYRWGSDWVDEGGASLVGHEPEGHGEPQSTVVENLSRLSAKRRKKEHVRIAANWDPTFPSETTNWYDEYIQRNAPTAVSWFQKPQVSSGSVKGAADVSGVALYKPSESNPHELFAVSPLADGSVCLWDIKGTCSKKGTGTIYSRSSPGLLCADGPETDLSRRSKMINTGVTECVSVDSQRDRAFFTVQSRLVEVDLRTLAVVDVQPFEWSITTLSAADPRIPLTIGTVNGLHLHDYRSRYQHRQYHGERTDYAGHKFVFDLSRVLDPRPLPPYAPLAQSGPQSILHLDCPGNQDQTYDIFVGGRFSNILHYDRRMFPSIKGSIHSGARLCSLASLPYPFSSIDSDLRRRLQLSEEQVKKSKNVPGGRTLIACGEYNTKGSLELYGLSPAADDRPKTGSSCNSVMKNRQTASKSKLLSVINHGTRILFSDGQGYLKWVERDGFTEVRRLKIGKSEKLVQRSLFASMPALDELARKLLPTGTGQDDEVQANNDDILFWTGEKLGLVSFTSKPGFSAEDFEDVTKTPEELAAEHEEMLYSERMRQALERQANEARFVQHLGAGNIRNGF